MHVGAEAARVQRREDPGAFNLVDEVDRSRFFERCWPPRHLGALRNLPISALPSAFAVP
jgi:hypothetical protein